MTGYKLRDRFQELSSLCGILVILLGTVLPQLVSPHQLIVLLTPFAAIIGALMFFLPENRGVITADHVFLALLKMLPANYRVPVPDFAPTPEPERPTKLSGLAAEPAGNTAPVANKGSIASLGSVAAMLMLALFAPLLLSGCTSDGQLTPQARQIIGAACKVDGVAQPIAVSVVPTLVPQATPIASIDNALVHPAVVKACDAIGGTPVAVTMAPAPVPAVTAPAVAPAVVTPPATAAPAATAPAAKN